MTGVERERSPSVKDTLYLYPKLTLGLLITVAAVSALGFAQFPNIGLLEIGIGTLSQIAFALACKLIFFLMRRIRKNRSFSVGDGTHLGAILLLFAVGFILGIGPAMKVYKACPTCSTEGSDI